MDDIFITSRGFDSQYSMFNRVQRGPVRKIQTYTERCSRKEGQRSPDRDCSTDGRLSLEKQTLQNEELK